MDDVIIRKLNEISTWIDSIIKKSKPIHELDELEGKNLFIAVSDGEKTGRKKFPVFDSPDESKSLQWNDVKLGLDLPIHISNDELSFNLLIDNTDIFNGFQNDSLYDGVVGYIRNGSSKPIQLKHNVLDSSKVNTPLFFSSEASYYLQPNEILSFKYSLKRNRCEINVYDFSAITPLKPQSEVYRIEKEQLETEKAVFELKYTPSENEFLLVFCNGQLLNSAGISMVENILMIDKKTIEYEFKVGMKITVNYKY